MSIKFLSFDHNFKTHDGDNLMIIEWSTCQLSENATCGQGVRTRLLSCVRSDGKPVSMDQCEQVIYLYLYGINKTLDFPQIFTFAQHNT